MLTVTQAAMGKPRAQIATVTHPVDLPLEAAKESM
jgi:hypothetical protein